MVSMRSYLTRQYLHTKRSLKMTSGSNEMKRKPSDMSGVSPPPLRRKVQSMTTQTAVASFFTPLSQKPPDKTIWEERAPHDDTQSTLVVGRYEPSKRNEKLISSQASSQKPKVAAFDFDSTLIQTSSGKRHASEAEDWRWWHLSVPSTLKKLQADDGYTIAILSNQAGITLKNDPKLPKSHQGRHAAFKSKVSAVFSQLDIPISIYAATEKDLYRKPRTGMWGELLEDQDLSPSSIDLEKSFFVGDAGGRTASVGLPKDFSSSDRDFADNVGIKFHTPEEFFLKESPRPFRRTFEPASFARTAPAAHSIVPQLYSKQNKQDIVLFCGSPGAGKSTFYWSYLQPLKYDRINQDILKTRERCTKVADELLSQGKSIVIDNTNADKDVRGRWIDLAARHKVPIRCVLFLAQIELCEHNNAVRALNITMNPEKRELLPKQAFVGFSSRYQRPELAEGFQDITEIRFEAQKPKEPSGVNIGLKCILEEVNSLEVLHMPTI